MQMDNANIRILNRSPRKRSHSSSCYFRDGRAILFRQQDLYEMFTEISTRGIRGSCILSLHVGWL